MIRRLRFRMTFLVIAVLVVVSVGIVLAIHLSTQRNIAAQAETSSALAEKNGNPGRGEMSKPDDDGKKPDDDGKKKHESEKAGPKTKGSRRRSVTDGTPLPRNWATPIRLP